MGHFYFAFNPLLRQAPDWNASCVWKATWNGSPRPDWSDPHVCAHQESQCSSRFRGAAPSKVRYLVTLLLSPHHEFLQDEVPWATENPGERYVGLHQMQTRRILGNARRWTCQKGRKHLQIRVKARPPWLLARMSANLLRRYHFVA